MKRRYLVVIFILCLVLPACGGNKTKSIRDVIPDFSSVLSESDLKKQDEDDDYLDYRYHNVTKEQYDKIVDICMSSGFDNELRNVEISDDYWRYDAYDKSKKYLIEVFWEPDKLHVMLKTIKEKTE